MNEIPSPPVIPVLVTGIHTSGRSTKQFFHFFSMGRGMDSCDKHRNDAKRWLNNLLLSAFIVLFNTDLAVSQPNEHPAQWPQELAAQLCKAGSNAATQVEDTLALAPSGLKSLKVHLNRPQFFAASGTLTNNNRVDVNLRFIGQTNQQTRVSLFEVLASKPVARLLIDLSVDCSLNRAVFLIYKKDGRLHGLHHYSKDLNTVDRTELLNPPVPVGVDPGGVAVAHYDTGVNYRLDFIARRLARSKTGKILGYDFKDNDRQPFDLDPSFPAFLPRRHGTAVISIFLREAPDARLIPFRHPGKDITRFGEIVEATAQTPAKIVVMSLGGYNREQWQNFASAAHRHDDILFIISAGNDGRNIDEKPIYPASFTHDNFLVVTSTDAFGRLPIESNWGVQSVDVAVPAERLDVIDHRGAKGKASGSSYAVPRIAALAARLAKKHPLWSAFEIKNAITALAGPRPKGKRLTKFGWIALPNQEGF